MRQPPLAEEVAAGLLGPDQLPEADDVRQGLGVGMPGRIEVVVGPLQVPGEAEQLAQEEAGAGVGRPGPHVLDEGRDGVLEPARLE